MSSMSMKHWIDGEVWYVETLTLKKVGDWIEKHINVMENKGEPCKFYSSWSMQSGAWYYLVSTVDTRPGDYVKVLACQSLKHTQDIQALIAWVNCEQPVKTT